jgi:hypothetical protein
MRSEDLLFPEKRFECFQALAAHVGLTMISTQDLCCQSRLESIVDYGKSSIHSETHNDFFGKSKGERISPIYSDAHNNVVGKSTAKQRLVPSTNSHSSTQQQDSSNHYDSHSSALTLEKLQQEEIELLRLASYFREREMALEKLDASLQTREESLKRLEASLKELDASLLKQHHKEQHHDDTTQQRRRRLLQEEPVVAAHLKNNFTKWKQRFEQEGETIDTKLLIEMIRAGKEMVKVYQANASLLKGTMDLQEIVNVLGKLQKVLKHQDKAVDSDPAAFLLEYNVFKDTVEHDAKKFHLNTILRFITYGNGLVNQWSTKWKGNTNKGVLEGFDVQTIHQLVSHLELLANEVQQNDGPKQEEIRKELLRNARKQQRDSSPAHEYDGSLGKNSSANVKQRYGKWQGLLANNTKLSEYLHREGAEALKVFGYKPQTEFAYYEDPTNNTFSCNANVECPP